MQVIQNPNLFFPNNSTLTPREAHVADMMVDGMGIGSTAYLLGISEETVKSHRKEIKRKTGLDSHSVLPWLIRKIKEIAVDG